MNGCLDRVRDPACLSAWMSRLGNGGVSKCYAPITAFRAQSPDHIPTCYLTVHADCLSLYLYS